MSEAVTTRSVGTGRLKVILLAVLFFLPVVAATVLFKSGWRPQAQMNHGELVQPARPLTDVALTTLDGREIRVSQLGKKWTMLYFGPAECDAGCMQTIYKMRQVQAAQGKDADRVQYAFVVIDPRALDQLHDTVKDYPDMLVITGSADNIRLLARQFALPAGTPLDGLGRIYLTDPLGNFMMSYPADADPSDMRKDLARLLKVSKIG